MLTIRFPNIALSSGGSSLLYQTDAASFQRSLPKMDRKATNLLVPSLQLLFTFNFTRLPSPESSLFSLELLFPDEAMLQYRQR